MIGTSRKRGQESTAKLEEKRAKQAICESTMREQETKELLTQRSKGGLKQKQLLMKHQKNKIEVLMKNDKEQIKQNSIEFLNQIIQPTKAEQVKVRRNTKIVKELESTRRSTNRFTGSFKMNSSAMAYQEVFVQPMKKEMEELKLQHEQELEDGLILIQNEETKRKLKIENERIRFLRQN